MQKPEETAPESEAESLRRLGFVEEGGVVQLQLLQCVPQLRIVVGVGREQAGEDHRFHVLVSRNRLRRWSPLGRDRVADAQARYVLQAGDDVADLAGLERR